MGKVIDINRLVTYVAPPRQEKIALTNGCFDVLTPAHFDLIRFARAQGDVLVVAVNSDESVRALKGPNRPIHNERDRAACVAAIQGVDYVVLFGTAENPSVEPVVEEINPDVLVKGGNYRIDEVVGRAFVERSGGRVVISPERPGVSTTATLEKLRDTCPVARVPKLSVQDGPRATGHERRLILLDMDGVLVDFPGEIIRRLCPEKSYADFRGEYDLGKALGLPTDLYSMVGPDFWESAPWMDDGKAILNTCEQEVGAERVILCSSPTHESSSAMGKLRWIEHHLGEDWLRRYIFTPCKWACARPGAILIDDSDAQVTAFREHGGSAFLVPRPWNSLWRQITDHLLEMQDLLRRWRVGV